MTRFIKLTSVNGFTHMNPDAIVAIEAGETGSGSDITVAGDYMYTVTESPAEILAMLADAPAPTPDPRTGKCDCGKIEHGRHHSACPSVSSPTPSGQRTAELLAVARLWENKERKNCKGCTEAEWDAAAKKYNDAADAYLDKWLDAEATR